MLLDMQRNFMDCHQRFLAQVDESPAFRGDSPTIVEAATTRCDVLPAARDIPEALAIARAFISAFSPGNDRARLHLRGHEEAASGLLAACLLLLHNYFPPSEYSIANLHRLFGYELERGQNTTLDHLFGCIGTGYQGIAMILHDNDLVAPAFNKGLTTPSNLVRLSDHLKPYEHVRDDGARGFTTGEDEALEAHRRYRIEKRASGLAAAQACQSLTAPFAQLLHHWNREAEAVARSRSTSPADSLLARAQRAAASAHAQPTPDDAQDSVDLFERVMLHGLTTAACDPDTSQADRTYYESLIASLLRDRAVA